METKQMKKKIKQKLEKHEIGDKLIQSFVNLAVFEGYKIVKHIGKKISYKTNRILERLDDDDEY